MLAEHGGDCNEQERSAEQDDVGYQDWWREYLHKPASKEEFDQ